MRVQKRPWAVIAVAAATSMTALALSTGVALADDNGGVSGTVTISPPPPPPVRSVSVFMGEPGGSSTFAYNQCEPSSDATDEQPPPPVGPIGYNLRTIDLPNGFCYPGPLDLEPVDGQAVAFPFVITNTGNVTSSIIVVGSAFVSQNQQFTWVLCSQNDPVPAAYRACTGDASAPPLLGLMPGADEASLMRWGQTQTPGPPTGGLGDNPLFLDSWPNLDAANVAPGATYYDWIRLKGPKTSSFSDSATNSITFGATP